MLENRIHVILGLERFSEVTLSQKQRARGTPKDFCLVVLHFIITRMDTETHGLKPTEVVSGSNVSARVSACVRPLQKGDWIEWCQLWKGYLEFYKTELPEEMYSICFERMMSESEHEFHGLVAEKEGKIVGIVHYLFHRHGWRIENICYLQDLYVLPDQRGGGVGRTLIEAVYKIAEKVGSSVYWNTADDNVQARILYDKVGKYSGFVKYNSK
jgi:GNAT superfamily N-acetyltransferase